MLSYQHIYHAGNLADVQKHALLAWMLAYLTRKDKPLSYIETHAGRALYDLASDAAVKTGEAAHGIRALRPLLPPDHPYAKALALTEAAEGPMAYPGSPLIATHLLRAGDTIHLAELHPAEHRALCTALPRAHVHLRDGFDTAHALVPPTPRRGLMLIDPSYEIKDDFKTIPGHLRKWHRAWNVGVICVWYPILRSGAHKDMCKAFARDFPDALNHQIHFTPARDGHGMTGSGLFVINPPFGLAEAARELETLFKTGGVWQSP
ncbi:MAG: 23S rRNA (adenine(2030)-N(6))-methyltransferase RlmJ [Rhodobacteraceae bacterium]|nr:23S rRNA (adenine(2030)-N(6))-methyltransferase RlmJ [Paracoccaceae bacterium]